MKVIIQTPNFRARKNLLDFVQEKVDKLQSFSEDILEGRVCPKLDKSEATANNRCEIKLLLRGNELFASGKCNSFEGAVVKTTDALRSQIERWKGSRKIRDAAASLGF